MNDEILERVKNCLVEHLKMVRGIGEITPDADLRELGLDSMAATNALMDIESEFAIAFPDALLVPETFHSAASLATAVRTVMTS